MTEKTRERDNDLALAPNEYAYIMDMTKGQVTVYVGPNKTSLAATDLAVVFDDESKSFMKVSLYEATQLFKTAPEGWYLTLYNPAEGEKRPTVGTPTTPELQVGNKVNIPGPCTMALWPGQMARVVKGHRLNQNQYLVIRVYNEKTARESFGNAVVMSAGQEAVTTETGTKTKPKAAPARPTALADQLGINASDLKTGLEFIIKGTDVSFFIPPTGIEVVHDGEDYIRNAVTLEQTEYALLKDQDGNKRYERGPQVVFPRPTECFDTQTLEKNGKRARKFRAIELNENSGICLKVIAPYEEGSTKHKPGQELFITGKEEALYFPRVEHSLIKYGDTYIHYGVAIPEGEARYVLRRNEGKVKIVRGPCVYLADPREEVMLQRALDPKLCSLMYPGNLEALAHNQSLLGEGELEVAAAALADVARSAGTGRQGRGRGASKELFSNDVYLTSNYAAVGTKFQGDGFKRNTAYTPPRTITLNTKFDGAVQTDIWEGYAVMFTRKSGGRRVEQGPKTVTLEYDETPHVLSLSTGKPKTTDSLKRDVFLKTRHNNVTDLVEAETVDFCNVKLKLVYSVNFEGKDPSKWFAIENYVKYLCDHMRSVIRNHVKTLTIGEFHQNATNVIRDLVLGAKGKTERKGWTFTENGMRICDVEVLNVYLDKEIQSLLVGQERDSFQQMLQLAKSKRELEFTKQIEALNREKQQEFSKSNALKRELARLDINDRAVTDRLTQSLEEAQAQAAQAFEQASQEHLDDLAAKERNRKHADSQLALDTKKQYHLLDIEKMEKDAAATAAKASAINPQLVAALQSLGDAELVAKLVGVLGDVNLMKALGADDLSGVIGSLFAGSKLAEKLPAVSNGKKPPSTRRKTAS